MRSTISLVVFIAIFALGLFVENTSAVVQNIAPVGTATQSTTGYGGVAELAIDGNTDGQFFNGSVTHTSEGQGDIMPYWELALPIDFDIESVSIWNRTDCCGGRLRDLTISIFDDGAEIYNSFDDLGDYINPGNILGSPVTIELDLLGTVGAQTGDMLRIQKDGDILSMAEVQIFADTNLEPFPVLEIVRENGAASLRNNTLDELEIAGYSIRSSEGNLDATGWLSIAENYDADSGGAFDPNNVWIEFTDPASVADISEGTLGAATLPSMGTPLDLGNIWTPNPTEDDLAMQLLLGDGLTVQPVEVMFVNAPPYPEADFNEDGSVNGDDFLIWQSGFDQFEGDATKMDGDANTDGVVDGDDFLIWQSQFGSSDGASAAAVPEPSAVILAGLCFALVALSRNRKPSMMRPRLYLVWVVAAVTTLSLLAIPAVADFTVDRDYTFGDDPDEDATAGADVGSGPNNTSPGSTLDSEGTDGTGDLQHLSVVGDVTYVDVTGRPMGGTGLGAQFSGADNLFGTGLGFPSGNMPNPNADYSGIFTRGFMGWVKPAANGLGTGLRQDIVVDTSQFQVFLNENDRFGLRHGVIGLTPPEREVVSNLTAQADSWYHFHLHSYGTQPGVLYIDGMAVAMVNSFYGGGTSGQDMVIGAGLDQFENFFDGTIDDLQFYVAGVNDSDVDYGTFNVLQDNPFMAEALAGYVQGDLTGDGIVAGDGSGDPADDDVAAFVDNWLFEKLIPASDLDNESILLSTGDMETRLKGDFNLDGITDLLDWGILRNEHPDGGSLDLGALLGPGVPEPSTGVLLGLIVAAALVNGARRRRSPIGL